MKILKDHPLKSLNTFHVEVCAREYIRFESATEILDFLSQCSLGGTKFLILGGGSNLLFTSDYDGLVLHPQLKGVSVVRDTGNQILVKAMAGENWDDFVAVAVANGWGGIENLSHIPGNVGACPVQNIGAYGVEAESVIESVEAVSLNDRERVQFTADECGFGYRYSHFKGPWKDHYIITAVTYRLSRNAEPVTHYPGVREALKKTGPVNPAAIREAVIRIRKSKLPDPDQLGNAGSFFKNPVITHAIFQRLKAKFPQIPHYPHGDHNVKLPAGWLIDQCGWKGKSLGRAAVHHQQALVLVNKGGATGEEIWELSERIRNSVQERFDIELEREVQVIR